MLRSKGPWIPSPGSYQIIVYVWWLLSCQDSCGQHHPTSPKPESWSRMSSGARYHRVTTCLNIWHVRALLLSVPSRYPTIHGHPEQRALSSSLPPSLYEALGEEVPVSAHTHKHYRHHLWSCMLFAGNAYCGCSQGS